MDAPRRQAVRILAVSLLVLLGGSLLAPDSVQTWADTQPGGWRRSLATAWADPVGRLSRSMGVDRPLAAASDALDTGHAGPSVTTLPPATRPTTTSTTTSIVPTTTMPTSSTTSRPSTTTSGATTSSSQAPTSTVATSTTSTTSTTSSTTTTSAPPSPPTTLAPRVASPEEPLRILAVGDSLMLDLQYGLARVLGARDDVHLTGKGALGFGFTVPHWDWDEDVLTDYDLSVAQARPEVIVMMIGANEFEGYVVEGEALPSGSDRWREVLAERADEAVAHWLAGGGHVYWWTTPLMRDSRFSAVGQLNEIWIDTMAAWAPAGSVLDTMRVLGDGDGRYRDEIVNEDGSIVPLRKEHGVHFLEIGADLLAEQLEEQLVADGWLVVR
ncbi:MAG: DUF459 domain-containing protein [Acidimicrobiales bacterium]|nr:DUF459 domain-containing protein [Acidimicrobiales bacterium]